MNNIKKELEDAMNKTMVLLAKEMDNKEADISAAREAGCELEAYILELELKEMETLFAAHIVFIQNNED